ncbi:hypothetical protein EON67_02085 [archaeon]|nr:MAG: hypothetical protein EON67_02085 [archaeon]
MARILALGLLQRRVPLTWLLKEEADVRTGVSNVHTLHTLRGSTGGERRCARLLQMRWWACVRACVATWRQTWRQTYGPVLQYFVLIKYACRHAGYRAMSRTAMARNLAESAAQWVA